MNGEIVPTWKSAPQRVRFFRTKAQARAMWNIGKKLANSKTKKRKNHERLGA